MTEKKQKYAISACLMGINCKYSGGNNLNAKLKEYMKEQEYILICPEVLGGLTIPRESCELVAGNVKSATGKDFTQQFQDGMEKAMKQIVDFNPDLVILQPRSPSCGVGSIYDGTFSGKLISGNGLFADALLKRGMKAVTIDDFLDSQHMAEKVITAADAAAQVQP